MGLSDDGKNVMLDALAEVAVYVSLHDDDPGTDGSNEISGGSYARQAITWNTASGGALDDSDTQEFDVPAATTVAYFGLWSASTAGTFYGGAALSASETFGAAGTYTLSDADVTL